jgi:hypothetical protein
MYTCERCGTRFGRPSAVLDTCPRCLARDGLRVTLTFSRFEKAGVARADRGGLQDAVRERLSTASPALRRIAPTPIADPRSGSRNAAYLPPGR